MTKEREPRPTSWAEVRRYGSANAALVAYEAARDLILEDELEASAFRVTVDGVSFVTVLGERTPPAESLVKICELLAQGSDAQLPPPVLDELRRRRRAFRRTGAEFLERRTRPSPEG